MASSPSSSVSSVSSVLLLFLLFPKIFSEPSSRLSETSTFSSLSLVMTDPHLMPVNQPPLRFLSVH